MQKHNTHLLSEESNENHGYAYDKYGNIIADSLDDLIYDKFIDIRERKRKNHSEARKLIKNIIDNEYIYENSPMQSSININRKSIIDSKIRDKKEKKKSIISISRSSIKNNEIEEEGKEKLKKLEKKI